MDCKAVDKFHKYKNFELEVRNIFLTNTYKIQECEQVSIKMSWPRCEGFRLVQTLNDGEKEKCKTSSGLFEVLNEKFKPQQIYPRETSNTVTLCVSPTDATCIEGAAQGVDLGNQFERVCKSVSMEVTVEIDREKCRAGHKT